MEQWKPSFTSSRSRIDGFRVPGSANFLIWKSGVVSVGGVTCGHYLNGKLWNHDLPISHNLVANRETIYKTASTTGLTG